MEAETGTDRQAEAQQEAAEQQGGEKRADSEAASLGHATRAAVAGWGVAGVARWLEALQLPQYAAAFEEEEVDGAVLLQLDAPMLRELDLNDNRITGIFAGDFS